MQFTLFKRNFKDRNMGQEKILGEANSALNHYEKLARELKKSIIVFPGNVIEYERFRGYKTEIVDLDPHNPDKRFFYNRILECIHRPAYDNSCDALMIIRNRIEEGIKFLDHIKNEGIEALVNITYYPERFVKEGWFDMGKDIYGLPVRKARQEA